MDPIDRGRRVARMLGPVGTWLDVLAMAPHHDAVKAVQEVEALGYGAVWVGEYPYRKEPLTMCGMFLAATSEIIVGSAIASIWSRRPMPTVATANTLAEAYGERFMLGLGVSHAEVHQGLRPSNPRTALRAFLDDMDACDYDSPAPTFAYPRLLGALGPKMIQLAGARADGMISFFVTPEHTAAARESLGPSPTLAAEQAVVVSDDPDLAFEVARAHVMTRLALGNYVTHLRRLGFDDADFAGGGSRRLVDRMVAYGSAERVAARVREQHAAGADHVAIHPLAVPGGGVVSALSQLRTLRPAVSEPRTE